MTKHAPRGQANTTAFRIGLVAWLLAIPAHFLFCGYLAHAVGAIELPGWMAGVNQLFRYGPGSFLDICVLVVWIVVIGASLFGLHVALQRVAARLPASAPVQEPATDAFTRALLAFLPVGILLWLALAILPVQSHNLVSDPRDVAVLHAVPWTEAVYQLTEAMFALFTIASLFAGLFFAASFFESRKSDSVWPLFAAILFGIGVCVLVGLFLGPLVTGAHDRYGALPAFWLTYGAITLIMLPAGFRFSGYEAPKTKPAEAS